MWYNFVRNSFGGDIVIKYSDEEGFIKAKGIKFRDGQDKNIILPKVAVGVFSRHLFNDVVEKFSCKEVGYIATANVEKNVYILITICIHFKEKFKLYSSHSVDQRWVQHQ